MFEDIQILESHERTQTTSYEIAAQTEMFEVQYEFFRAICSNSAYDCPYEVRVKTESKEIDAFSINLQVHLVCSFKLRGR